MNSNIPHPMDELIDRELQELRAPAESAHRIGDAIRAMQTPPSYKVWQRFKWPIGVGSAAVAVGAIIVVGSFSTANAYAGELREIASAQHRQKTMHQKSYLFGEDNKPAVIMEFWFDHERQAYRQYTREGALMVARVFDGGLQYHYNAPFFQGSKPWASYEKADSGDFGIQTIDSYLNSSYYRKRSIEKKSGVMLNGRRCDYYSFANGTTKLWIDPATKLPLKREILAADGTIWKRDFYDYPTSFAEKTFKPFQAHGLKYIDYTEERKKARAKYGNQSQHAQSSR